MSIYSSVPHRVPSPNPNPAPQMFRSASPIPSPQPLGASPGQIAPGTITYTTSYDPNGTLIYHPFRAVPVSYQTANGVVAGTQWVPADATTVLPANAQPANADFASSWNRNYNRDDEKALREWQKDEDKRRRKEEKEAAKRVARAERERRERDAMIRPSSAYGGVPIVAGSAGSGYAPTSPYASAYTSPVTDLERRFEQTDISQRPYDRRRTSVYADPARPASPYAPPAPLVAPPSPITTAANPGYAPAAGYYPPGASPYRAPGALPGTYPGEVGPPIGHPRSRAPSPIPGAGPYGSRSRAASPIPASGYAPPRPRSRAASPMPAPYGGSGYAPPAGVRSTASPRPGEALLGGPPDGGRLLPPDGFARPPNLAQSYTWFDLMKIQDMEMFYDSLPRMPLVLVPHDVYHDDWIRFMQDLALAWAGRLPAATGTPGSQKNSSIAMDLIELWNQAFFHQRGVDVILYRGRERRTGRRAGQIDATIPGFDDDGDDDDSSSSSSSLSDSDDEDRRYASGMYAAAADPYAQAELRDAKRLKKDRKAEKKRRHKEKKARRKAKERERRYALYISCIPQHEN